MRILHVTPTYLPAVRYGGTIHAVHGLAAAQAALGHEVEAYTTNVDGPGVTPTPIGARVDLDGVGVTYFETGLGRRLYRSPSMGDALRRHAAEFDILHLHSIFLWPTMAAARIATRHGAPYVLSPHGMLVASLVRAKSTMLKSAWIALFERRTLREAAAVHVTSWREANDLKSFRFDLPPVAIIGLGVDAAPLGETQRDVGADVAAAIAGSPFVLAFGRISWKKNIAALVEAVARTPDLRCVIAGNDDEGGGAGLARLAARLGVADRVTIIARQIDEPDRSALYRACLCLALVSLNENFGNVVLEAMSHGRPVLVSSVAGAAEVVAAASAGVLVAPEVASIAHGLATLLSDPRAADEMGARGRQVVEQRWSWRAAATEMIAHYEGVLLHEGVLLRPDERGSA
ncbi:GDP-mannose:cellobiosyl-diphosphopolyprenol+alpha-mannosyltransferase [Methylocapsa aurea]|jgi:glycosyltransferase involved in cell wall biosynthesis|uniref:glycosyltransferase n=1 Tax=Methylocapsa aurea TaxID=663610 RepID=UPI003D18B872